MKRLGIIAALSAFLLAVFAVPALAAATFHGAEPTCSVNGTTVNCTGADISGVGNDTGNATLVANYTADVTCGNPAGGKNKNNPIEAQQTDLTANATTGDVNPKNGRLTLKGLTAKAPELTAEQEAQLCPGAGWDAKLSNVTLTGYTYTITIGGEQFFTLP
jgi:hypothetical protein